MTQERTLKSEYIYRGRVVTLRLDTVEIDQGHTTLREVIEHGQSVVIVPVDYRRNVLLVRQFRKAIEESLLEVPAGGLEPGESPDQGLLRELREETGYTADSFERLGGFYATPGYSTEYFHLYLARSLRPSPLKADADERIEVVRVPLEEVPRLIRSGEIRDCKSFAALLAVLHLFPDRL